MIYLQNIWLLKFQFQKSKMANSSHLKIEKSRYLMMQSVSVVRHLEFL